MMKIYQVISDCDTILTTRSESKAYKLSIKCEKEPVYIVEMYVDSCPHHEVYWDNLEGFRRKYL